MTAIIVLSVPGEELSHDGRDAVLAAPEEDMDVIVHEDPGKDGTAAFGDVLSEPFEESRLVLVVLEDGGFIDPTHHDMVQGAGDIQSCLAGHGETIGERNNAVKQNALKASTSLKLL